MHDALLAGSAFGFVIGLCHAAALWRAPIRYPEEAAFTRARYALWTVALWTLFGSYVLWLWLPACAAYAWFRWRGRA